MSKSVYLTCVFIVSALALSAQTTLPAVQTTGMVGLSFGETAQLNLLNPGVEGPAIGATCTASVSFVDAAGTVLKSGTVTAEPGKSAAFALVAGVDLAIASGDRHQIRATFSTPAVPPPTATTATAPIATACHLIPTLEILDTLSGRTLVVTGHVETVPSVATAN